MELNEAQFYFLKGVVDARAGIIIIPDIREDDPQDQKDHYAKNFNDIQGVIDAGFLENVTDKFAESQEEAKKRIGRTFKALAITELAIQMFAPSEGSAN
jgi:hypothetical protein